MIRFVITTTQTTVVKVLPKANIAKVKLEDVHFKVRLTIVFLVSVLHFPFLVLRLELQHQVALFSNATREKEVIDSVDFFFGKAAKLYFLFKYVTLLN